MGGFARLKEEFEQKMPWLEVRRDKQTSEETFRQDAFRSLYLHCLFEIAGNLDSIALHTRALLEQTEKGRIQQGEHFAEAFGLFKETLDKINNPLVTAAPIVPPGYLTKGVDLKKPRKRTK